MIHVIRILILLLLFAAILGFTGLVPAYRTASRIVFLALVGLLAVALGHLAYIRHHKPTHQRRKGDSL